MEYSYRTNFIITRLTDAIADMVGKLIRDDFDQWSEFQIVVDDELNVSYIHAEEAIEKDKFDNSLLLCNYVEIFEEDGVTMIGNNIEKCEELADKYSQLVEFGVIQTSKWHEEWDWMHQQK